MSLLVFISIRFSYGYDFKIENDYQCSNGIVSEVDRTNAFVLKIIANTELEHKYIQCFFDNKCITLGEFDDPSLISFLGNVEIYSCDPIIVPTMLRNFCNGLGCITADKLVCKYGNDSSVIGIAPPVCL